MQGASTVSRMLFLPDGTLLVSTWGETGQVAQDKMGLSGKILRYNINGPIPKDNPFVGKEGPARDLHARPSHAREPRLARANEDNLGVRDGPERRRRNQRHQGGQQLRLAARESRPILRRSVSARGLCGRRDDRARRRTSCRRSRRRA